VAKKRRLGGIDIGGTKVHAIVAKANGRILGRARKRLNGNRDLDNVVARARDCLRSACRRAALELSDLTAVGIGAPSGITPDGIAVNAPNLGWHDVPVVRSFSEHLRLPVTVDNDCNAAALGEYVLGAGRGARTLVAMMVGTGLGGGIIHRGEMLAGTNSLAAELGHVIIVPGGRTCCCGRAGCLEAYASKNGLAASIRHAVEVEGRTSMLAPEGVVEIKHLRSGHLAEAYHAGDEVTREAIGDAARHLGLGIANLITILGPDRFVLGGGVLEKLGEQMIGEIREAAREWTFPPSSYDDTKIVLSTLGDDAVALGCVVMASRGRKGPGVTSGRFCR